MLLQIGSFIQAHQVAIAIAATAVLDLLIEINPNLKANTAISLLLGFFKKESGGGQPPAA